jgi:sugar phosphate isomerase/epimerase
VNNAKSTITRILHETGIPNKKLAVETIEFPLELTLELVKELNISICFDTGHVLAGFSGPVNFFDALIQCMPYIVEFHLHDSPQHTPECPLHYGKDHQPLGKGDLDIRRFFDLIIDSDFSGPIILELSLEYARVSLTHIRKLCPDICAS